MAQPWKIASTALADSVTSLRVEGELPGSVPAISEPIDKGADALLGPLTAKAPQYSPLEIDYLLRTLDEHLANCIELRHRAQDLEVRAFAEAREQVLQEHLLGSLEGLAKLNAENEPRLLSNQIEAGLEGNKVIGQHSTYWSDILDKQQDQIAVRRADADSRLSQMSDRGSGMCYVARFDFIRELFRIDLTEAYLRASAVSLGLKAIHGIDLPLPAIASIGYLNDLVLWARKALYTYEKRVFDIHDTTVGIPLHNGDTKVLMTADQFKQQRSGGTISFSITDDYFSKPSLRLRNPRLRGLQIYAWAGEGRDAMQFWPMAAELPEQTMTSPDGWQWTRRPRLVFPMVTYPGRGRESSNVPVQRQICNATPIGDWRIVLERVSLDGTSSDDNGQVGNLILCMRLTYERAA